MGKLDKLKEKIQHTKKIKEAVSQIRAMRDCPYCNQRREEILEHQKEGHPKEC